MIRGRTMIEFRYWETGIGTFEIQVIRCGEVVWQADGFRTEEQIEAWIERLLSD
jgi:hypothetical protein